MAKPIPDDVKINRKIKASSCAFSDIFTGFENVACVKRIFGKETKKVLQRLRIKMYKKNWYMWVDEEQGNLCMGKDWLKKGSSMLLYLDAVHELVHIKQHMNGTKLFDESYDYVDRPTEIEAYKTAVREAKRLGMSKNRIIEYLSVPGWLEGKTLKRLCDNIGM